MNRAFTLIELLVVVAIIAILAAIALPNFIEAQTRAKVARVRSDLRTVAGALEAYRVDQNDYPFAVGGSYPFLPGGQFNFNLRQVTTPISYLTSLPSDVFNSGHDPVGNPWSAPGRGTNTYDYYTYASDVINGTVDDVVWLRAFGPSPWKLSSPGPDGEFINDGSMFGFEERYDPTNGTISLGDLVRSQTRSD